MSTNSPVRKLNAETARKIAAGEVIDRPNAIVRELLDNAVDSGADLVTMEITGGGIESIRIVDNGCGMTKKDLETCAHPHCTSKISSEVDLMNLSTLGFRGEALASIAAVSRLSIISSGWKMRASITEDHIMEPFSEIKGTIVMAEGLFENFPARRQFLKRPASEGLLCKTTFIEKCLPRPDIAFRLKMDGETKLDLPAGVSFTSRFVRAMGYKENEQLFYEINSRDTEGKWSIRIILGEPAVNRSNKKDIYIFVNGRRIQEYSLVQAVEYGGQGFFPNGTFPVAAVFVDMDPKCVDFNIHPAKREARFSDISSLHHGISSTVRNFYKSHTIQGLAVNALSNNESNKQKELFDKLFEAPEKPNNGTYKIPEHKSPTVIINDSKPKSSIPTNTVSKTEGRSKLDFFTSKISTGALGTTNTNTSSVSRNLSSLADKALNTPAEPEPKPEKSDFKFLGCTLGTFLVAEKNGSLFIIDQHAAHERILFNHIMAEKPNKISLIIPYILETEDESENAYLENIKTQMSECGFEISKSGKNTWEVNTTPDRWKGSEKDLREAILSKRLEPNEIIRSIAAMTACRAAVMDGHILDDITAAKLAEDALKLEDPHCPHGRPVYTELSREKLFFLVKRT